MPKHNGTVNLCITFLIKHQRKVSSMLASPREKRKIHHVMSSYPDYPEGATRFAFRYALIVAVKDGLISTSLAPQTEGGKSEPEITPKNTELSAAQMAPSIQASGSSGNSACVTVQPEPQPDAPPTSISKRGGRDLSNYGLKPKSAVGEKPAVFKSTREFEDRALTMGLDNPKP